MRPRTLIFALGVALGSAPLVAAQSVGRGWPMAEEAGWVGAGGDFNDVAPNNLAHCNQTFFVANGRATPLAPGTVIEYRVEDLYGRPWAAVWEEYFEQGMQRPEREDIFSFE